MSNEMGPDCIRCGLCCIAAPCDVAPLNSHLGDICRHLHINEDLTTTCMSEGAKEIMVGPGCFIRGVDIRSKGVQLYDLHLEEYDIESIKKAILKCQKEGNHGTSDRPKQPQRKCGRSG